MLSWLAILLAAPGFTVTDNQFSPASVSVTAGTSVTFAYPVGEDEHNARFSKAGVSCSQTAGDASGPTGQSIPESAQTKGWAGECTFSQNGTYEFSCDLHPEMTGTVVVGETPPAVTPTPTPAATPAPVVATPVPTPVAPIPRKLKVASTQKGSTVKGTITGVTGKITIEVYLGKKRVGRSTRTGPGAFKVKVSKRGRLTLKVTAAGKTDTKKITLKR